MAISKRKPKPAPAGVTTRPADPAGPGRNPDPDPGLDRRLAALAGALVGDALGIPFAGMYPEEIEDEWGCVDEIEIPESLDAAPGSDYTQFLLMTLTSIRDAGGYDEADVAAKLVDWSEWAKSKNTSTYKSALRLKEGLPLHEAALDVPTAGGALRVMPYGALYRGASIGDLEADAAAAAMITHVNPKSVAAAVSLAVTVHGLATGTLSAADPADFVRTVGSHVVAHDAELGETISHLVNLFDLDVTEGLRYISTSYDASECYPAAVYCFALSPDDFERSLIAAANAGLATDALAFMTGALSGAANGLAAIPERWTRKALNVPRALELARGILGLA